MNSHGSCSSDINGSPKANSGSTYNYAWPMLRPNCHALHGTSVTVSLYIAWRQSRENAMVMGAPGLRQNTLPLTSHCSGTIRTHGNIQIVSHRDGFLEPR
jgi:hypothetical protein